MTKFALTTSLKAEFTLDIVKAKKDTILNVYEWPEMTAEQLYAFYPLYLENRNYVKHMIMQMKCRLDIPRLKDTVRAVQRREVSFGTLKYFEMLMPETPEEFHKTYRQCVKARRLNVYDPAYIAKREDIPLADAEKYIADYKKAKCTSLEGFILRHGEAEGTRLFERFQHTSDSKSLDFYLGKYEGDREKAFEEYVSQGRRGSKRCEEYYMARGHSRTKSRELVSEYQKTTSGVHREYYEIRGYSTQEIDSIMEELTRIRCLWLKDKDKKDRADARCRATNELSGLWRQIDDIPSFVRYRNQVDSLTNKQDKRRIPNYDLRGVDFHLDHRASVKDCYDAGLTPQETSHVLNLRIVPTEYNLKKGSKSEITPQELLEKIKEEDYENNIHH